MVVYTRSDSSQENSLKIFLTGGTGLVGSNVLKVAREKYDVEMVASLFQRRPEADWGCETVHMDLEDLTSIRKAVEAHRPDAVIHCAQPRDEARMEVDHEWNWALLVTATRVLAEACRHVDAKLIFVSSDWIFGNGGKPPYSEESAPCPASYFGLLKVVGETVVSTVCPNYAIARTSGVYGPIWSYPDYEPEEEGSGFGWLPNYYVSRLRRGEAVAAWTDHINVWANPSLASDVADAFLTIAHQDQRGTFHCCGREGASRLELAKTVADVFGYDQEMVRAASPEEMDIGNMAGPPAPRDSRVAVESTEARLRRTNLGFHEGLKQYQRQLEEIGTLS